jgi:hypothetical protein
MPRDGQVYVDDEGNEIVWRDGDWHDVKGTYMAAARGAETIKPAHPFQQPINLGEALGLSKEAPAQPHPYGSMIEGGPDDINLPSAEAFTEWIPAVGGALGATAGLIGTGGLAAPLLAGLGSGAGEAIRQEIRESQGFAPATGVTADFLNLDPSSKAAKAGAVMSETGVGALAEFGAKILKHIAPKLRRSGVKSYAKALDTAAIPQEIDKLTDELMVIEKHLPSGGRKGVRGKVQTHKTRVGEELDEIFKSEAGSRRATYDDPIKALKEEAKGTIETPAHLAERPKVTSGRDIFAQLPGEKVSPPVASIRTVTEKVGAGVREKDYLKAVNKRIADLEERIAKRKSYQKGDPSFTARELRAEKQKSGVDAQKAASEAFADPKVSKGFMPEAKAAVAEYSAQRKQLRKLVPESAIKDDEFTAFSKVFDLASQDETSHFLARWGVSRAAGGPMGTGAGLLAGAPFVPRTYLSKTIRTIANLMEKGEKAKALHLFRQLAAGGPDENPSLED